LGRDLRLLILDDSLEFVSTLLAELRRHRYRPVHLRVCTTEALDLALSEASWDVVIADYSMPDFKAAGALRLIRTKGFDLPVIFVSQDLSEDVALAVLRAGAQDYLLKSQLRWIGLALERTLRASDERRAWRQAEAALRSSAGHFRDERCGLGSLVVLCDARGNVTSCSPELLELLGYEREDVVGRNWIQYFVPREQRDRIEEAFLRAVTSGSSAGPQDHHVVTLLGALHATRWSCTVLVDGRGRVVGTASVGFELTNQRSDVHDAPPAMTRQSPPPLVVPH
jgi:PAS domain S-box-containing protein